MPWGGGEWLQHLASATVSLHYFVNFPFPLVSLLLQRENNKLLCQQEPVSFLPPVCRIVSIHIVSTRDLSPDVPEPLYWEGLTGLNGPYFQVKGNIWDTIRSQGKISRGKGFLKHRQYLGNATFTPREELPTRESIFPLPVGELLQLYYTLPPPPPKY